MRTPTHHRTLAAIGVLAMLMAACTGADEGAEASGSDEADGGSADSSGADPDPSDWDAVLAEADGQTVNWFMFGGDAGLNAHVTGIVTELAAEEGVTVNQVRIEDTVEAMNAVLGEQQAGVDQDGSVDLIWVNGENFRTGKQADLWFCDWAEDLPNAELIPWEDPAINADFGTPVDGCEAPWNRAQSIVVYDGEEFPDGFASMADLFEWIQANPGRFTHSAPPDFTGAMTVRTMLYGFLEGYEELTVEYDEATFDEVTGGFWDFANELKTNFWREGETFPQTHAEVVDLFANDQIDVYLTYEVAEVVRNVQDGVYPDTVRGDVFTEGGNIGNTNYVGIPYNSPNKAGAMVLANVLQSVEAQVDKAAFAYYPVVDPARTDDPTAFDVEAEVVPPFAELAEGAVPEISGAWISAIDEAWQQRVLQQ